MSSDRVEATRKQIVPAQEPWMMAGSEGLYYTSRADTIQLSKTYHAIEAIDLEHEPCFIRLKGNLTGPMCTITLITNDTVALYEFGCQWAPLSGQGKTLKLTLLEGNKLIISVIQSWIS